jgi:hypothetical protein
MFRKTILLIFALAAAPAACRHLRTEYQHPHHQHHASFYLPTQSSVFYHLARKSGTDKVTAHHYEHLYSKYFEMSGKRFLPLKILEIGLGCDMGYGPGASASVW